MNTELVCEKTGADCAVGNLVGSRNFLRQRASEVRQRIAEARGRGDVTDYTEAEKMAQNDDYRADKIQTDINQRACAICPFKIA